jgi:hypothetical protein
VSLGLRQSLFYNGLCLLLILICSFCVTQHRELLGPGLIKSTVAPFTDCPRSLVQSQLGVD